MKLRAQRLQILVRSLFLLLVALLASSARAQLPTVDGFYGVWYSNEGQAAPYYYKYSGGLGTYTHQTSPIAIYSEDANRTYFVYGGTNGSDNNLRNFISYFDHDTGLLARPRQLRNVGNTNNNHRNATFTIDEQGHILAFGNSHGNTGTANFYKSTNPYDITSFQEISLPGNVFNNNANQVKLAYSNPFYVPGEGLIMVYSQYDDGRAIHIARTTDGVTWNDHDILDTESGHYAVARQHGNTISVTADFHRSGDLDNRTNLYYFQTNDFGETWTNAAGTPLSTPLTTRNNSALVYDYFAENRLVYMKDIDYDAAGNPILLYLTVSDETGNGHRSGPQPGGRTLHTAHWTGSEWQIRDVLQTDHNYDHGELYVEADGTWRLTGPFLEGPQAYGTGGEIGVWTSSDQGATWQLVDQLTENSQFNHTYVRIPVNPHDDFFAFWADGNAFGLSESRFYFTDKAGNVYQMPTGFSGDFAAPILVRAVPEPSSMALLLCSTLFVVHRLIKRSKSHS